MKKDALISDCGRYRYGLIRAWNPDISRLTWVMLNPSTADANVDDATIRRCIGFAKKWGFGGINVVNLFAYRATDPRELLRADDPVGPENVDMLRRVLAPVVVAWGAGLPKNPKVGFLVDILKESAERDGYGWWCLGRTLGGEPRHPLRLNYSTKRQGWPRNWDDEVYD